MNKQQTQIQFEAETFMHENQKDCPKCDGFGFVHPSSNCPVCNGTGTIDYMDVYAEPPRRK